MYSEQLNILEQSLRVTELRYDENKIIIYLPVVIVSIIIYMICMRELMFEHSKIAEISDSKTFDHLFIKKYM